jgi:hypothetical protein
MAIINKNDLKQLSNTTYIDNTQGLIRPQDVRFFNDTLIDSIVDETGYSIDSGSWNAALLSLTQSLTNIFANTGSYVTNDQTQSMSVGTASYVDLRGKGITVNYGNGWIELTGSQGSGGSQVYIDATPPSLTLPTGSLWFDSVTGILSILYEDVDSRQWVEANYGGTLSTASFAQTASYFFTSSVTSASHAISASWAPIPTTIPTASYFFTASVTSASRAELAGEALWYYTASVSNATYAVSSSWAGRINVTGSGIGVNWYFDELQLTGSAPEVTGYLTTQSFNQWTGSNTSLFAGTSSLATRSITANTASYINVTGSGVYINWNGSQLQLTGSGDGGAIVSDTPPTPERGGQLWYNSINTSMYVAYDDGVNPLTWIGIAGAGPVVSASYSVTSSHSITALSALYAQSGGDQNLQSVTSFGNSTSQSIDIRDRIIVNITGSGTLTQGQSVEARGDFSHAQGYDTWAGGDYSHAEGDSTSAYGESSHAEGSGTVTIDAFSHAEGEGSVADGVGSHAEGYGTRTVGRGSHAEGAFTLAEGNYSHAEGESTHALGRSSNASGLGTVAQGIASNTEGRYTNAREDYQSVVGQWNIPLDGTDKQSWFIIGDGNGLPGHPRELHNLFMAGDGKIIISGTLDISGSILGISQSNSYIAGPGIVINGNEISSSVLTVNGVAPDPNGNIATALTNVITGTSGSLIISSSGNATGSITEGTVWVVSGMTGSLSASNGVSYIWDGKDPGEWLKLSSLDIVTADQRYVIQSPSTLFLGTASFYEERDTLQSVTTRGNHTTRSVIIGSIDSTANGQYSLSLGYGNIASGVGSHAQGWYTSASGVVSHAEGERTTASGRESHAEGHRSIASNDGAHAEGGYFNTVSDWRAGGTATGRASHAEGIETVANGMGAHSEGYQTVANGSWSHAEGFGSTAIGDWSHAEGIRSFAGTWAHSEGYEAKAYGNSSHAEGDVSTANGARSHAEGYYTIANGSWSHTEGISNVANGEGSHAEGQSTTANGLNSHAEGWRTITNNMSAHAEGDRTTASGNGAHSEGLFSTAAGNDSHAEGGYAAAGAVIFKGGTSIGAGSHAEGHGTTSVGLVSHAEGGNTIATGYGSHAEGNLSVATGDYSHAQGLFNIANGPYQNVVGQYNRTLPNASAFIVGNGVSDASRSNLIEAYGNSINLNGTVLVNGNPIGSNADDIVNTLDTYTTTPKVTNIVSLTLTEYNAIVTKNPNILYIVRS